MNELTAELHALAAELAATGVPTTVDPGEVLNLVQRDGVCVLVEPAESVQLGPTLGGIDLSVPVRVITSGPYDLDAVERLDEALWVVLQVVQPVEPTSRGEWDAADAAMPSVTVTARRRVHEPSLPIARVGGVR